MPRSSAVNARAPPISCLCHCDLNYVKVQRTSILFYCHLLQTHLCTECSLHLFFVTLNLFFMLFSEPLQSIWELTLKFSLTARFYFCYPALMDSFCLLELLGEEISQRINTPIQFETGSSVPASQVLPWWSRFIIEYTVIHLYVYLIHPLSLAHPPCCVTFVFPPHHPYCLN